MDLLKQHQFQEKLFLQELRDELTLAETVVQNLALELSESQGDIADDPEAERFFQHLANCLGKMRTLIERREQELPATLHNPKSRPEYPLRSPDSVEF